MWKKCLMPLSPREESSSRCNKLFCESIPIANIGLPAFFIASAAGVPSSWLMPSVIKTVSAINSYNTISKSPLAHHNHRRCTELHKKCDVIPCCVNGKNHQMSLCASSRHARDETTDNCKMIITIIGIRPLGRFGQRPELNQVHCHYLTTRLDVPTFATRCLHFHQDARDPSSGSWNCEQECCTVILPKWRFPRHLWIVYMAYFYGAEIKFLVNTKQISPQFTTFNQQYAYYSFLDIYIVI